MPFTYLRLDFDMLQWVVQGAISVDIGANPSAEGGDEDEGVDDQAVKVVDIVDTFRLQVTKLFSQMVRLFHNCACVVLRVYYFQQSVPSPKKGGGLCIT